VHTHTYTAAAFNIGDKKSCARSWQKTFSKFATISHFEMKFALPVNKRYDCINELRYDVRSSASFTMFGI